MFSSAGALDALGTLARKSTKQSVVRINKLALQERPFINNSSGLRDWLSGQFRALDKFIG